MKILVFFLSFLVLASYSLGAEPVRDTDGDYLWTSSRYYIWPEVSQGPAGPLTLNPTRNQNCSLDVVQELANDDVGVPFAFTPVLYPKGVIREETDMNIKFTAETLCNETVVWTVKHESNNKYFVRSGGVEGNPGPETARNWFKIIKYMDGYKLLHCPSVCIKCEAICRDVGIVKDDYTPYLGLSEFPVKVVFKRA
ncbi:kunitz trypsin inhibitor 5-like [Apium graveolens]|uniref:kunitz trypsin inhibitor 5-like n=1 Tax=Apium graveolens TaxID=4045 RepID=UPI003D797C55